MPNKLKITKADGMVHYAPIATARNHVRLNNILQKGLSRIEEVDENDKVITVIEQGSGVTALAGQAEIARLKFENEKLLKQLSEKPAATTLEKADDVIKKIMLADSEIAVNEIVGEDTRLSVLKAAKARIESFSK